MIKLGDVIKNLFSDSPIKHKLEEAEVLAKWELAVGESIARHTKAYYLKNGILYVKVNHPTWRQELFYRKHDLLKKLHRYVSKDIVKDIKFK
jgi:predicted nucleic acid-binding Zn ribbon protein